MIPVFILAGLPAMMRYDEDLNTGLANRGGDSSQIVEQPDFVGDASNQRPELAAIGQEIIIGIDEEQNCPVLRIVIVHHLTSPSDLRGGDLLPRS